MALTITNPDSTTPATPAVPGYRKHVHVKVTLDNSYPTGGYALTPSAFGLGQIESVRLGNTAAGRIAAALLASGTWSLKVFSAVATEVTNATDLSADSVLIEVIGR